MPDTLAQLETRLAQRLADTGNAIWSTDALEEAIRSALEEYNQVAPRHMETVITLPGDGHEIALSGVNGLLDVIEVWWPYDSSATSETWPPNQVKGFRLWWDDAQPVLFLDSLSPPSGGAGGGQPQQGDELRLWYTTPHTIQDLDGGDATTLPAIHEGPLLNGAAGHAASRQQIDRAGAIRIDQQEGAVLREWGEARLAEFRAWLDTVRARSANAGQPWPPGGWTMDAWDARRTGRRDY